MLVPEMGYPRGHILCLPSELLVEFLLLLDGDELSSCKLVCKLFRAVVESSVQLRYKIELAAEGFLDGPRSSLSTLDRLDLLLERRRRWLFMDWSQKLSTRGPGHPVIQIGSYDLLGGLLVEDDKESHLIQTKLPSGADPAPQRIEKFVDLTVADLTMDPSQDLLVMMDTEGRVHVRSLSSHTMHPLARVETLPKRTAGNSLGTSLQIAGDLVGLFYWADAAGLMIWNWHTGSVILREFHNDIPYKVSSFAFLSSRAFLLNDSSSRGSLVLYALSDDQALSETPLSLSTFLPIVRLDFPELRGNQRTCNVGFEIAPLLANVMDGQPFTADPKRRICVIQLAYLADNILEVTDHLWGFVHCQHLLSFVPLQLNAESETRVVPWKEWGPEHTRMMEMQVYLSHFARYMNGQRVVLQSRIVNSVSRDLYILDFNIHPHHLSAALDEQAYARSSDSPAVRDRFGNRGGRGRFTVETQPSRLNNALFLEDVVTSLPYVKSRRAIAAIENNGYMIDEERLVELKLTMFDDDVEAINVCAF